MGRNQARVLGLIDSDYQLEALEPSMSGNLLYGPKKYEYQHTCNDQIRHVRVRWSTRRGEDVDQKEATEIRISC